MSSQLLKAPNLSFIKYSPWLFGRISCTCLKDLMKNSAILLLSLLLVLFASSPAAEGACHKDDLDALLAFKAGVVSTSGRMNTWKGEDCCSWATVKCNNKTGRVISLIIEGSYDGGDFIGYDSMNGTISASLAKLSSLEILALEDLTYLSGNIPASIGKISTLKGLFLDGNNLSGPIPSSLGSLSRLERLYLSKNRLSGAIPAELGSLKQLRELGLESNQLTGSIPASFGGLGNLQKLDASNNQITGEIPASFGHLSMLTTLYLFNNRLTGSLPSSLGNLTALQDLRINDNLLSGSLPSSLSNCRSLKLVMLYNNKLSGELPSSWGSIVNLTGIALSNNHLSGEIPKSFAALSKCSQLSTLDLSFNQLVLRTIPSWLETQKENYFRLSLASCGLQSIPAFLSNLTGSAQGLFHLNLSHNPLDVTLSSRYTNFRILNVLDLRSTLLKGSLSPVFDMASKEDVSLTHVDLNVSFNKLTGGIPANISNLKSLVVMDLSHNQLSGQIPVSTGTMNALENVNLSSNKLTGGIPRDLLKLKKLAALDLSYNQLTGKIPHGKGIRAFPAAAFVGNPGLCGTPLPACK